MNKTNFWKVMAWQEGTRKGMGANLFVFAILMFVVATFLAAKGHPLPASQVIDVNNFQLLLTGAGVLIAGGAQADKNHERKMKELDIKAKDPSAPTPTAV